MVFKPQTYLGATAPTVRGKQRNKGHRAQGNQTGDLCHCGILKTFLLRDGQTDPAGASPTGTPIQHGQTRGGRGHNTQPTRFNPRGSNPTAARPRAAAPRRAFMPAHRGRRPDAKRLPAGKGTPRCRRTWNRGAQAKNNYNRPVGNLAARKGKQAAHNAPRRACGQTYRITGPENLLTSSFTTPSGVARVARGR